MENTGTTRHTEIDPVCGMEVVPGEPRLVSEYHGRSFWFCAPGCQKAFEADPEKYLNSACPKRKGWFRRYLDRMARANEKQFGGAGAKCH